jgi:GNAT superfamily N-acetyltransferase
MHTTPLEAQPQALPRPRPHPRPHPRLRPVCADDLPAMRHFVQGLRAESRVLRFHGGVKPDSQRLLAHLTQADGRHHIAWVAVLPCDDGELIVGEARVVRGSAGDPAELAIAVAEAWQGCGLASRLLRSVLAAAAEAGIDAVVGDVLAHNGRMGSFMQREGFVAEPGMEAGVQRWARGLAAPQAPATGSGWLAWLGRRLNAGRGLQAA